MKVKMLKTRKPILFLVTTALLFGIIKSVFADDKTIKKYKDYTPEQIQQLSEKVRESSVPMMFLIAAQRGLASDAKLALAMDLNTLMYPAINDYETSIKAFQSDLGEKPSGILTVSQIFKLQERADMQHLKTVGFPDMYFSSIDGDVAQVEGTTTILDDKSAWPINHVKVKCFKSEKYCEYQQIALVLPKENDWAQIYSVMDLGTDIYKITRWENGIIDAVPINDGKTCRTNSLNFNFKTKEFFETVRNADTDCKLLGKVVFEKLKKPRISQIIDGKKIIQSEFTNLQNKSYGYLASDFRKRVDALAKQ
jgi:5-hydroxyisourate hydrolase-like protein (transthyretin family)